MAKFRRLAKSLCLLFIISSLRLSLNNTLQGKEVHSSGTAKTDVSFQRDTGMKGKGLGGRKMMMETTDEMEVSTTSGVEHNGSNNSVETSSNRVIYQADNMKTAAKFGIHNEREIAHFTTTKAKQGYHNSKPTKPIKTSFKSSTMAEENESIRRKGVALKRQRSVDPSEEIESLIATDYDNQHMARQPPPINNHEPLD